MHKTYFNLWISFRSVSAGVIIILINWGTSQPSIVAAPAADYVTTDHKCFVLTRITWYYCYYLWLSINIVIVITPSRRDVFSSDIIIFLYKCSQYIIFYSLCHIYYKLIFLLYIYNILHAPYGAASCLIADRPFTEIKSCTIIFRL